jgi:hypothetical protein
MYQPVRQDNTEDVDQSSAKAEVAGERVVVKFCFLNRRRGSRPNLLSEHAGSLIVLLL